MVTAQRQTDISLRRAAILLSNLDADSRRRLLSHMPNSQAARLRAAAASLVDVDPLEVRRVVDAFVGRVTIEQTSKPVEPAGANGSDGGANKSESGSPSREPQNEAGPAKTLQFLNEISDQTLIHVVRSEHPQTVAIVLGALAPEQAAKLLRELPVDVRQAAIRRLGRLDEVPPDVLNEIAEHLRKVVGEIEPVAGAGGRKSLTSILALLDDDERQSLLGDAATSDRLVAAAMRDVAGPVKREPRTSTVSNKANDVSEKTVEQSNKNDLEDSNSDAVRNTIPIRPRTAVTLTDGSAEAATDVANPHDEIYGQVYGGEVMRQVDEVLEALKPRDLKSLLAKMETRQAILTLCGLQPAQVKRLMKCLPRRQVREVEQRMSGIGALELREIDAAKLAAVELLTGKKVEQQIEVRLRAA